MNSRRFLPRGSGASCRNSPVLYLHLAKTVHSTFSPSNAVLVVANRATELEGNDARNKEKDSRGAMAGGRTRGGGRGRGHAACSAETNDGGRAEGEVGKPLRHARSEQQPQLPRAEARLPDPGTDPRRPAPRNPVVGTRLVREWDGVEHTVTVMKDGFDWQGRKFKSLSAVARAITGTQWNGYRFFGLREARRDDR